MTLPTAVPELFALPRTTFQPPRISCCLQGCFLLVLHGAAHRTGAVIAVPQRDTACHSVSKAEKPPKVAPQSRPPDYSGPFVQVWGAGRGDLLCFSRFSISEVPCFPCVSGVPWLISTFLLGSGHPTGASKKLPEHPARALCCAGGCRLEEVFFFSCWL